MLGGPGQTGQRRGPREGAWECCCSLHLPVQPLRCWISVFCLCLGFFRPLPLPPPPPPLSPPLLLPLPLILLFLPLPPPLPLPPSSISSLVLLTLCFQPSQARFSPAPPLPTQLPSPLILTPFPLLSKLCLPRDPAPGVPCPLCAPSCCVLGALSPSQLGGRLCPLPVLVLLLRGTLGGYGEPGRWGIPGPPLTLLPSLPRRWKRWVPGPWVGGGPALPHLSQPLPLPMATSSPSPPVRGGVGRYVTLPIELSMEILSPCPLP